MELKLSVDDHDLIEEIWDNLRFNNEFWKKIINAVFDHLDASEDMIKQLAERVLSQAQGQIIQNINQSSKEYVDRYANEILGKCVNMISTNVSLQAPSVFLLDLQDQEIKYVSRMLEALTERISSLESK